ncbi:thymidylate kinase [Hydrogenimonas sp.]|nr:thymidylate kinase [Hydrogenimonas sp.]
MRYFILTLFTALFLYAGQHHRYTNHLIDEDSPYLQQHAHNPVDWYPWGEEAFEKAKREHKPIFLSIGYSTCHWCHVMEKESFENEEIAELINRWFVPIKVDREQMPHLDRHFQRIYSILNRRGGGWPLTIFLTEDLKPFFAATYIPPEDSYGVKGMKSVVPALGKLYKTDRETLFKRAAAIERLAEESQRLPKAKVESAKKLAGEAVERVWGYYDKIYGGFGDRPKFPESSRISMLLDIYRVTGDERAKMMALQTLDAMQKSGLYDQIEGAFFRYCVDRRWRMPHFEKMLYTNAELIPLYVKAYSMTGKERFKEVVEETVKEINRRFRTPEGVYFSASDADSDGEEGKYFLYRFDEALKALTDAGFKESEAKEFLNYLDITEDGNFDSEYSHARRVLEREPKEFGRGIEVLKRMRSSRNYPFIDRKIITAWNAMMIKALFAASKIDDSFLKEAQTSYKALKELMEKKDGTLFHQVLYGRKPSQEGLLEDYAFMTDAALSAYGTTLEKSYLEDALRYSKEAEKRFYKDGRWLLGGEDFKSYADIGDSYYRSPLSVMINSLISLAVLESSFEDERLAEKSLESFGALLNVSPDAYPEAFVAYLRLEKGVAVLKSSKENLLRNRDRIEKIDYPFLLIEAVDSNSWQACDSKSCFAYSKDMERVIEAVEKR